MNNLIEFFKKNFHYFLFAILLVISIVMMGKSMSYSKYKFARICQSTVGPIQKSWSEMIHRFSLGQENDLLTQQNVALMREHENMFIYKDDTVMTKMSKVDSLHPKSMRLYDYTYAHVIYKTTNQAFNYLIIDKGSEDGISRDMAVTCPRGVVGVISDVSDQIAYLENIPQHLEINIGDSVLTSGFSNIFPKGLLIGTVKEVSVGQNASFLTIKVKLATDFNKLNTVYLIENLHKAEIDSLKANFKNE